MFGYVLYYLELLVVQFQMQYCGQGLSHLHSLDTVGPRFMLFQLCKDYFTLTTNWKHTLYYP